MKIVQIPINMHPRQIDDFADGVERSKKGALYFVPGTTKSITDDEYEWLKAKHKRFCNALIVVAENIKSKLRIEQEKAAAKAKKQEKVLPKNKLSKAKQRAAELLKKKSEKPVTQVVQSITKPTKIDAVETSEDVDVSVGKKKKGKK